MSHRRYTKEFKQKVLREADEGINVALLARRYAVSRQLIYEWREKQRDGALHDTVGQRQAELQMEVGELQRKVGQLTMENEFLKKTLESLETRFPNAVETPQPSSSGRSPKARKGAPSR
jgi:transposase-like protein